MKIPFDIKYRSQIESGKYKITTRANHPVRLICWDANDYGNPIVAISGGYPIQYTENGKTCNEMPWNGVELNTDLVIVTDDSELTEFEKV